MHFQYLPGLLTCVHDSGTHGALPDHRSDNVPASVRKGHLTKLPEGLASTPGTHRCTSGSPGTLTVSSNPSHTPLLLLEANRLHLPAARQQ